MDNQTDLVASLRRIEDLLTVLVKSQLSDVISHELSDKKIKQLYDLTGGYTARELEKRTNYSLASISRIWQRWESLGLLIKDGKTYRKVL